MTDELDTWLQENGSFPLIQVMMPPAIVPFIASQLEPLGLQLLPLDLGEGELPTLTAVPDRAKFKQVMAAAPETPTSGVQPGVDELEELTGFRRHPVTEDPPQPERN